MNKLIKLTALSLIAFMPILSSCDNDDDPKPGQGVSIDNVFSEGLPLNVNGATFTTNENGQVTKIVDGSEVVTFEYGTFSRNTTPFNVLMKLRDNDYPEDGSEIYMRLNKQGFVEYALQVYQDTVSDIDEWRFEYNADGQLTRFQRSESGDDFKITYTNGNITKVVKDDEDGDHSEYAIIYTNDEYETAVANKGNVMMFDDFFLVDMDEMGIAYFAGLLGKSTKNLPMGYEPGNKEESDSLFTQTYHWVINSDSLPTKFWSGENVSDAVTFTWK